MQPMGMPLCPGKHYKMERFMEVCLLLLLQDEISHGYALMEQLEAFGFSKEELNVSTLYRTLRTMEQEQLVTSSWEEGGPGPKRRTYKINNRGRAELSQWIDVLVQRKTMIETLINRYEQTQKKENQKS